MDSSLQMLKEEERANIAHARQETKADLDGLREGMESLREGIKQVTEDIASIKEKMKEGFVDVKEELGSMMRFSYADLEKRFNALEARIKALEKMVFP
jgi:predicted  nucleic acid-binding Zn-ribbon protein